MEEEKTEGLLLHSISYLGDQKILKVFTPDAGLISLIAKKKSFAPMTSPFLVGEWVYRKGKEEIHLLKDATLLNSLSDLREDYAFLEAAGSIAKILLRSQLPAKKGSGLYALCLAYLNKLPSFQQPEVLVASFQMKLLLHEGLLALQKECPHCDQPTSHLFGGESLCSKHTGFPSIAFNSTEWETLHTLTYARQFALLGTASWTGSLKKKIEAVFEERILH